MESNKTVVFNRKPFRYASGSIRKYSHNFWLQYCEYCYYTMHFANASLKLPLFETSPLQTQAHN